MLFVKPMLDKPQSIKPIKPHRLGTEKRTMGDRSH